MAQVWWLASLAAVLLYLGVANGQNKPVFTNVTVLDGKRYREDIRPGQSLGFISARDPDGGTIRYSLAGEVAQYVEANEVTGDVTIKVQFDYELDSKLTVIVIATDSGGDFQQYVTNIDILDANDLQPVFSETAYKYDLPEDTRVGYIITTLYVYDNDTENAPITVTCDSSIQLLKRACDVFGVTPTYISSREWRGNLTLKLGLDYELEKSYSVRFNAFDGLNRKPQEIQIGVLDVNDSPPFFVRARSSVIDETSQIGVSIDYVSAVDTDDAVRRPIRYELYGAPESLNYFLINNLNGTITNRVPLDYEQLGRTPGKAFTLEIRARELLQDSPLILGNDATTTATAVVLIRLNDNNDNCPTFDLAEYTVHIREDITQGANIPLQMTVTDKDLGPRSTFDLTLIDTSNQFAVTPTSGHSPASVTISIVSARTIDYETPPNTYNLVVTARENQVTPACSGTARVRINIVDVNDESPQFGQQSYRTTVSENAKGGTSLITITARDRESGNFGQDGVRYSLIGYDQNLFAIDPISGVVTVRDCNTPGVASCLDYEKVNRYDLAVEARDNLGGAGALRSSSQLTIDVLNVNDNPPKFQLSYYRSIREGEVKTTDPLFIHARDPDRDNITYSIPDGQVDARLWQVNPITGEVTAIQPIQYSDVSNRREDVFRFRALARDGGNTDVPVNIEIKVIAIYIPKNTPGVPLDKSESSDSLVGAVVGAVLGAGLLLALSVVIAALLIRSRNSCRRSRADDNLKPSNQETDLRTIHIAGTPREATTEENAEAESHYEQL